jgi:hypothetical protein
MRNPRPFPPVSSLFLLLPALLNAAEIWKLDNTDQIGGHAVVMLGEPKLQDQDGIKGLFFDGAKDGIILPALPIAGAEKFTVEILFYPAEGGTITPRSGLVEERFFHLGDRAFGRLMMETRKNGKGVWWLDHFISTPGQKSIVSIDPKLTHPTNRWYWVAVCWDGEKMTSYINAEKEFEKPGKAVPFVKGQVSLGVRQTIEYWFKGGISEVRFHREALPPEKLQRVAK